MVHGMVSTTQRFTFEAFNELLLERKRLYVVSEYLSEPERDNFRTKLPNLHGSDYKVKNGAPINRIGETTLAFKDGAEGARRYFQKAIEHDEFMRSLCHPFLPPHERVISDLGKLWPGGAMIAKIDGQLCNVGLMRIIPATGIGLPPHIDAIPGAAPHDLKIKPICDAATILFGNVYVEVGSGPGGRLQVWDHRPSKLAYEGVNDLGYGAAALDEEPVLDYAPKVGDVALGFADCYHAVTAPTSRRVTVSFFIAVPPTFTAPLLFYS